MTQCGVVPSSVAVVGMDCRLPGAESGPDSLWTLLDRGGVAICETPRDRFDINTYYSADLDEPGRTYSRMAGYISSPFEFDAGFFGISPSEAIEMDPQQRMLLELIVNALQRGGFRLSAIRERRVGLFVASGDVDYARRSVNSGDLTRITAYAKLGTNRAIGVGQIAYRLGLQGPAILVDTTCSSSLTAVHLAVQSLRNHECDLAIAGGANLILGPEETIGFAKLRAMSRTDSCRPFDAAADGYMRGEGGGVVVLKRAEEARDDGDCIGAIILGSAINNDGPSNGLTAPNGAAQEVVIRSALQNAGCAARDVSFLEAHGTGTPLGDPIELSAASRVYSKAAGGGALLIGAIKANIGHLEAAAGIASLLKVVLVLQHRLVPPQPGFEVPNPHFNWASSRLFVPRERVALKSEAEHPIGAVSAFGMSGTNVHLILKASPGRRRSESTARPRVLPLSARSPGGIRRLSSTLLSQLETGGISSARDLCFSAATGRDHESHRLAIVGCTIEEYAKGLSDFAASRENASVAHAAHSGPIGLAFLFSGQGSWRTGIGHALYLGNPTFRATIDECAAILRRYSDLDLYRVMFDQNPGVQYCHARAQPAHFCLQVALARVWLSSGLQPDAILGHSLGEYAAAFVAGVFSLEDALRLVSERGRLFDALAPPGAMLVVHEEEGRARELCGEPEELTIACYNGPKQVVLSGSLGAIERAEERLNAGGVRSVRLDISTCGHSRRLASVADAYRSYAASSSYQPAKLPLYSSVTGTRVERDAANPEYWTDMIVKPVLFQQAFSEISQRAHVFLEVGPADSLRSLIRHQYPEGGLCISSLMDAPGERDDVVPFVLAQLYAAGCSINWRELFTQPRPGRVELPPIPFERGLYELPRVRNSRAGAPARPPGKMVDRLPGDACIGFESICSSRRVPVLTEHALFGAAVYPGAGVVLAALEAWGALDGHGGAVEVRDIVLRQPIRIDTDYSLYTRVKPLADGGAEVTVSGKGSEYECWKDHATLTVLAVNGREIRSDRRSNFAAEIVSAEGDYERLESCGLTLGPAFRRVREIAFEGGRGSARIGTRDPRDPCTSIGVAVSDLDATFQAAGLVVGRQADGVPVPASIDSIAFIGPFPEDAICEVCVNVRVADSGASVDHSFATADVSVFDAQGNLTLAVRGLVFRLQRRFPDISSQVDLYRESWSSDEPVVVAGNRETARLILEIGRGIEGRDQRAWFAQHEAALREMDGRPVEVVLNAELPSISSATGQAASAAEVCMRVLEVTGALVSMGGSSSRRMTIVTRQAISIEGKRPLSVAAASLWGLVRTLSQEHPEIEWTLMDTDQDDFDCASIQRVQGAGTLLEVARREGRDLVRRIVRAEWPSPTGFAEVHPSGWHIIAGGGGAIGKVLTEFLLSKGAKRVAVMSRRGTALTSCPNVQVLRVDVTDEPAVRAAVEALERTAPVKTVFHCAAVLDDAPAMDLTLERILRVMQPKIAGAWNLHRATLHCPLEGFFAFSSAAGTLGNAGQAHYAAANACLDQICAHRRAIGLPGQTIAWGLWGGIGAGTNAALRERMARRGIAPFTPEVGLAALERIRLSGLPESMPANIDWNSYASFIPSNRVPYAYSGLATARVEYSGNTSSDAPGITGTTLDTVRHIVARVSGGRTDTLNLEAPLQSLGFDSLALMELRSRLQQHFGRNAPVSLFMTGASLKELAEYFDSHGRVETVRPQITPQSASGTVVEIAL